MPRKPSGFEAALVQEGWKLRLRQSQTGPVEPHLHDLTADPSETTDLADSEPDRVAAMSQILLPKLLSLWQRQETVRAPSSDIEVARPTWSSPGQSRTVRHADIADGARLQWTGDPSGQYVVEYRAGDGPLAFDGTISVEGTVKDFGTLGEFYWRTWVVPYGRVRLRVLPDGQEEFASEWIEVKFAP